MHLDAKWTRYTFLKWFLWRRDAPSMSRLRECRMNLCSQLHRRWTWHPLVGHAVFLSRHWLWLTTAWCKALLNRSLDRMCMRSPKFDHKCTSDYIHRNQPNTFLVDLEPVSVALLWQRENGEGEVGMRG